MNVAGGYVTIDDDLWASIKTINETMSGQYRDYQIRAWAKYGRYMTNGEFSLCNNIWGDLILRGAVAKDYINCLNWTKLMQKERM